MYLLFKLHLVSLFFLGYLYVFSLVFSLSTPTLKNCTNVLVFIYSFSYTNTTAYRPLCFYYTTTLSLSIYLIMFYPSTRFLSLFWVVTLLLHIHWFTFSDVYGIKNIYVPFLEFCACCTFPYSIKSLQQGYRDKVRERRLQRMDF